MARKKFNKERSLQKVRTRRKNRAAKIKAAKQFKSIPWSLIEGLKLEDYGRGSSQDKEQMSETFWNMFSKAGGKW